MEQHSVPQHIASFEFKLFGNLTVRQFVTLAIPGAIAALFFFSNLPAFLRYGMAVIFGTIGVFASLVPINGRPLDKWAVLFIKAILSPTQRIWVKDARLPEFLDIVIGRPPSIKEVVEPITGRDRERLRNYLRSLPRGQVSPFDVKEQIAIQRLNLSMEGAGVGKLPPAVIWATPVPAGMAQVRPMASQGFSGALPQVEKVAGEKGIPSREQDFQGVMAEALPRFGMKVAKVKISAHAKPYTLPGLEKRLDEGAIHVHEKTVAPKVQLASDTNFAIENVIPIAEPGRRIKLVRGVGKSRARKLHFAPPEGFDLSNLPIRGEARFEISESLKRVITEGTEKSHEVTETGRQFESREQPLRLGDTPSTQQVKMTPLSVAAAVTKPNIETAPVAKRVWVQEAQPVVFRRQSEGAAQPAEILQRAQIVPLTSKPNVISGIVMSSVGAPIAGAIITVSDQHGVPVRALKTNKLGQFLSATALPKGQYTLEIDSEEANFEPLKLDVHGEVLSPLEIKPKGGLYG